MSTKTKLGSPIVRQREIVVGVKIESTPHEGGRDGFTAGDVLLEGTVVAGSRHDIANKLRAMADGIVNTSGDPMIGASILVLMRRP